MYLCTYLKEGYTLLFKISINVKKQIAYLYCIFIHSIYTHFCKITIKMFFSIVEIVFQWKLSKEKVT